MTLKSYAIKGYAGDGRGSKWLKLVSALMFGIGYTIFRGSEQPSGSISEHTSIAQETPSPEQLTTWYSEKQNI